MIRDPKQRDFFSRRRSDPDTAIDWPTTIMLGALLAGLFLGSIS